MDELEQRIVALGAALERGEIELAMKELQAVDLARLVRSPNVTPRLRQLIDRTLGVAVKIRDAREARLRELGLTPGASAASIFTERLAGPADLLLLVTLFTELFDEVAPGDIAQESKRFLEEDLKRALAAPNVRIYLAEVGGEVAGVIRVDLHQAFPTFRLKADHRCGYIDQMFVRPAYRKHGLGKELLKVCEDWLRGEGVQFCMLHAAPRAIGFYTGLGYQSTRELYRKL